MHIDLEQVSNQQTQYKQRQNFENRAPVTQRNTRPVSRVEIGENECTESVHEDLVSFESKIKNAPKLKYPNIELKRCFDAKSFRHSNE